MKLLFIHFINDSPQFQCIVSTRVETKLIIIVIYIFMDDRRFYALQTADLTRFDDDVADFYKVNNFSAIFMKSAFY